MNKGLDASKKVVNKACQYLGNKIVDVITNSNDNIEKQEKRKKRGNIKQIEKSIIKMEQYKISNLLNHSAVS